MISRNFRILLYCLILAKNMDAFSATSSVQRQRIRQFGSHPISGLKSRRDIGRRGIGYSDSSLTALKQNIDGSPKTDSSSSPLLVLLSVPMAWGTFEPAVRLVYHYQPNIPPSLFSFVYYLVAATALRGMVGILSEGENASDDAAIQQQSTSTFGTSSADDPASIAGLELGTYLFVGNALQVIGLQTVASDKAAFLLQLTTIFVPLVQCLLARNLKLVTTKTWLACGVALFGVALIGLDGAASDATAVDSTNAFQSLSQWNTFGTGDYYIMLGALFYSFHCIRLELYAKTTSAVKLAAAKATTETVWSGLVVTVCLLALVLQSNGGIILDSSNNPIVDLAQTSGDKLVQYVQDATSSSTSTIDQHWPQVALATIWTGLVTVAYTIYAQSYGQAQVSATTANLIYSIQPFFTALIAFLLLGETLGVYGYVGGLFIGGAVLLVVLDEGGGDEEGAIDSTSSLI